ncbi:FAD-dependent monooxygenase [Shimazuella sp. AN120528]|uniref:FAD-dependent oxidoreductase n=1 Tax=Shimazuella soli TaxID=1892854 RepID=UPI001F0FF42A|nr:FAD-dependent monooxygenase [Shimazuella soli]MCH5585477.1 FAD-dependent monooxygenase [Shimazuella soli]
MDQKIPVLIIGGGIVGLSTSLFLSSHGINSLLIERHPSTSIHPRAAGYYPRTMELYRSVGLESTILDYSQKFNTPCIGKGETLIGKEEFRYDLPNDDFLNKITPTTYANIPQDVLEPIVLAHARVLGSDIRFNTELVSFEQNNEGIAALIKNRTTGVEQTVYAQYLVAADGSKSPIRQKLKIPIQGLGKVGDSMSILFKADLKKALMGRKFNVFYVDNQQVSGLLAFYDDRSLLTFPYYPEKGDHIENFTDDYCTKLVRSAIGDPNLDLDILKIQPWEISSFVAKSYQNNRIFLVGDAAHVMPPVGGFGANTGIQDAHNLAWKLAYVLKGIANPSLLATFEIERKPIAEFTVEQATLRLMSHSGSRESSSDKIVDEMNVTLGYSYRSQAIIEEESDLIPFSNDSRQRTGQSGTRAPHFKLKRNNDSLSTLDLFGHHFVLLVGADGRDWSKAAQKVAKRLNIVLDIHVINKEKNLLDVDHLWCDTYGVTSKGAVLIRPDGFIGWKSQNKVENPEQTMEQALSQLLCLDA